MKINTVKEWLLHASQTLAAAGIESARLDSLILLEDCLKSDRSRILAHQEQVLTPHQLKTLQEQLTARATHLPLAYIRGTVEFYGQNFNVDSRVLVPRPESESIIELLLGLPKQYTEAIYDIGCGSGCLGITAKLALPHSNVTLSDTDAGALEVARNNAHVLGADVVVIQSDLLAHAPQDMPFVVLANLPYVPANYHINAAAAHEPQQAIFAGQNGLEYYKRMFDQIATLRLACTAIITESLLEQHTKLEQIARSAGYRIVTSSGLAQLFIADSEPLQA